MAPIDFSSNGDSRQAEESPAGSPVATSSHYDQAGFIPFDHKQVSPVGSVDKTGIDVLVVGTGFGGLVAALECARKGHTVRILERNPGPNIAGDMFFMGVSATKFFKHWPAMKREYDQIGLSDAWIQPLKHNGEQIAPVVKVSQKLKPPGMDEPLGTFQMRPLLYKMFLRQVERLGIIIRYNRKVVDYEEDDETGKGIAITEDGHRYEGDVVIAADGVGSKSQRIVGGQVRAKSSGRAMWRAAYPIENLEKSPEAKEFFKLANDGKDPILRTWFGPGTYALTLTRKETVVWIINHDINGTEAESWHNTVDQKEVLEGMEKVPGWSPVLKEMIKCTPPNSIVNFELLWRDSKLSWSSPSGRVVQIGDCAHSFLPASGNGATQAMEDAVSLAACLHKGGRRNIREAVRAHIKLRFTRNTCAQKLGFSNAELMQDAKWGAGKAAPKQSAPKTPKWVWDHDPETFAYDNYDLAVECDKKGITIDQEPRITPNYPPGYKYEPWTIDDIMDDIRNGREVSLGEGNWD